MKKHSQQLAAKVGNGPIDRSAQGKPLGSAEVAKLARVSLRQLQWWDEMGVIQPRHDGHHREYSLEQIQRVIALGKLRKVDISLQRCRKLIARHGEQLDAIVEALTLLRKVGLTVR